MNWLDMLLIILIAIVEIGSIIFEVIGIKDDEYESTICIFITKLFFIFLLIAPFIVLDKASGTTIGRITSVDKNFFGTTALYIKTSENEQEKYCIEFDEKLEKIANDLIGEEVKISYGKRVGIYSTGKCSQSPINKIELLKE